MKVSEVFTRYLIPSAFLLTGCCQGDLLNVIDLSEQDRAMVPYKGTEQLIFINSAGDTMVFANGTRSSSYDYRYMGNGPRIPTDCQGDYVQTESNSTSFQSTDSLLSFKINMYFDYYVSTGLSDKKISFFSISDPYHHNPYQSGIELSFGPDTIYNQYTNLIDTAFAYAYHDLLTIGTKSFRNIYEIFLTASVLSSVTKFYYSIREGIVGFGTQKEGEWYLDKVLN